MLSTVTRSQALDRLVAALERGVCDEAAAQQLYAFGPDAVRLALLAAARRCPRPPGPSRNCKR